MDAISADAGALLARPQLVKDIKTALECLGWLKKTVRIQRPPAAYVAENSPGELMALPLSEKGVAGIESLMRSERECATSSPAYITICDLLCNGAIHWSPGLRLSDTKTRTWLSGFVAGARGHDAEGAASKRHKASQTISEAIGGSDGSTIHSKAVPRFRYVELFAGIGGFRIALDKLGARCVFASELDQWAAATYAANFGEWPAGDITTVDERDIPPHDLLTAGFPCQPFSSVGKRLGLADADRGTMFWHILRIVRHHLPRVLLLENVRGLLTHQDGDTMRVIQRELQRAGYTVSHRLVNSVSLLPQYRNRLYIVALRCSTADRHSLVQRPLVPHGLSDSSIPSDPTKSRPSAVDPHRIPSDAAFRVPSDYLPAGEDLALSAARLSVPSGPPTAHPQGVAREDAAEMVVTESARDAANEPVSESYFDAQLAAGIVCTSDADGSEVSTVRSASALLRLNTKDIRDCASARTTRENLETVKGGTVSARHDLLGGGPTLREGGGEDDGLPRQWDSSEAHIGETDRASEAQQAGGVDQVASFAWPEMPCLGGRTVREVLEEEDAVAGECWLSEHQWGKVAASAYFQKHPEARLCQLDGAAAQTLQSSYRSGYMLYSQFVPDERPPEAEEQHSQSYVAGHEDPGPGCRGDAPGAQAMGTTIRPPRFFTPRECARLQGFPETFQVAGYRGANDGRFYRQIGNAVCPPVVAVIAAALLPILVGLSPETAGKEGICCALQLVVAAAPQKRAQLFMQKNVSIGDCPPITVNCFLGRTE
ncbi:hypothetical protein CYMTET_44481 [Cymbomonas tetramitiformis]|uniref:Cytosine-specific methyltransferase n=1 Tax=Cymbomonas tetramitiformis TaxID=36881 RepID=A0AAE0C1C6_9CHLO|nr:hypothetical protein CYMTET_44481 [Cymbomonas tetramitiformis]